MKGSHEIRHSDRYSAGALVLLGLYSGYQSLDLKLGTLTAPGAGLFPTVLSGILIALSIGLLFRSVRSTEVSVARFGPRFHHVLIVFMAMALYGALLDDVGFPLLTLALLLGMLRGLGKVSWPRSLFLALVGTVSFFVLFRILGVPLPGGAAGF